MGFSQQANFAFKVRFHEPSQHSPTLLQLPAWYRSLIQGFIPDHQVNLTGVGLGLVTFGLGDFCSHHDQSGILLVIAHRRRLALLNNNGDGNQIHFWSRIPSSFDSLELRSQATSNGMLNLP